MLDGALRMVSKVTKISFQTLVSGTGLGYALVVVIQGAVES